MKYREIIICFDLRNGVSNVIPISKSKCHVFDMGTLGKIKSPSNKGSHFVLLYTRHRIKEKQGKEKRNRGHNL